MDTPTNLTQEDKVYAALSYIFILVFIPLLLKPQNGYVQFHAKQGLVLFLVEVALWVVGVVPVLGWLIGFVGHIVVVILAILGIVAALVGRYWEMPFLGEYAKKVNL